MITLNFKNPEIELGLLARAQASGLSVEDYLLSIVSNAAGTPTSPGKASLSPQERAAAFEAWAASHRPTPPLSDFAVSRESIYDREDL